jgi:hypothetical protein
MSWIVEAPNNNPSVFVLISSTVFQIDGFGPPALEENRYGRLPGSRRRLVSGNR